MIRGGIVGGLYGKGGGTRLANNSVVPPHLLANTTPQRIAFLQRLGLFAEDVIYGWDAAFEPQTNNPNVLITPTRLTGLVDFNDNSDRVWRANTFTIDANGRLSSVVGAVDVFHNQVPDIVDTTVHLFQTVNTSEGPVSSAYAHKIRENDIDGTEDFFTLSLGDTRGQFFEGDYRADIVTDPEAGVLADEIAKILNVDETLAKTSVLRTVAITASGTTPNRQFDSGTLLNPIRIIGNRGLQVNIVRFEILETLDSKMDVVRLTVDMSGAASTTLRGYHLFLGQSNRFREIDLRTDNTTLTGATHISVSLNTTDFFDIFNEGRIQLAMLESPNPPVVTAAEITAGASNHSPRSYSVEQIVRIVEEHGN